MLCKQLLSDQYNGQKCAEWKNSCSSIIGEDVSITTFIVEPELYRKSKKRKLKSLPMSTRNQPHQLPGELTNFFEKNDQIHDRNSRLSKHLHKPFIKTNLRNFQLQAKG